MLSGALHEVRFQWPENEDAPIDESNVESMRISKETQIITDEVAYINGTVG